MVPPDRRRGPGNRRQGGMGGTREGKTSTQQTVYVFKNIIIIIYCVNVNFHSFRVCQYQNKTKITSRVQQLNL